MKRVLIVDDAIDLGRMLQDGLKIVHPEIPVSIVPSAEEALLESTRFVVDLLVTDLRLPGMSGVELIRKIRVRQPNVKVILMTGLPANDKLNKQIDEANADLFLRKPITTAAFFEAVDQLIGEGKAADDAAYLPEAKTPAAKSDADAVKEAVLRELAGVLPGEPVEPAPKAAPARKVTGILPGSPEPEAEDGKLSILLSGLRGSLGALSVILLDERGRSVAQAGDLPDMALLQQIVPSMMASLSAGAKISYLLGQSAIQLVQAFRGTGFDLVIAPVGQYALLISLRSGRSTLRLAMAFEEVLNAQIELSASLEAMGLHVQQAVEVGAPEVMLAEMGAVGEDKEPAVPQEILNTPLGQDPDLEKFEALFSRKKTGELRLEDPDAFWDSAAGEGKDLSQPGVLSFDQAQKLGLVPPEAGE